MLACLGSQQSLTNINRWAGFVMGYPVKSLAILVCHFGFRVVGQTPWARKSRKIEIGVKKLIPRLCRTGDF